MTNIIDYTYFNGLINIPNTDKPEVQQSLLVFINDIEPKALCSLLGYELFKAFNAGIAINPNPELRMKNLRDGVEYAYNGRLYYWKGFKYLENNRKFSMFANYIYFHYANNKSTTTTGVGEVVANTDNAKAVSNSHKAITAYNLFVAEAKELYQFLEANTSVYPEWNYTYWREVSRTINQFGI
jgi:hypothetical protein